MQLTLPGLSEKDSNIRMAREARGVNVYFDRCDLNGAYLIVARLYGASLKGSDLANADLSGADLRCAEFSPYESWLYSPDLYGDRAAAYIATLESAKLDGADLSGANLCRVNLCNVLARGTRFVGSYLTYTDLRDADLSGANLYEANLRGADLSGANLRGSKLSKSNLVDTNLRGADLRDTCLDPTNKIPDASRYVYDEGLYIDDNGYVHGWRTLKSEISKSREYTPGRYEAPFFSTDVSTVCHPGIYFTSKARLMIGHRSQKIVPVMAHISTVVRAGNVFRTKELWVVDGHASTA